LIAVALATVALTAGPETVTDEGRLSLPERLVGRRLGRQAAGDGLVTTNYRLGPFGFLAHPELTAESAQRSSGNYAILDHVAALQWVQRNIAAFGGNPANVTIFGESAGSWSVNVVQATPLTKGLFHRAIGESGAQFARNPRLAHAEKGGVALAKAVGADSLAALRAVPAEKILEVQSFRSGANVDGWVLPDEVRAIFAQKKQNDVPILVGSNANEWTTLSNRPSSRGPDVELLGELRHQRRSQRQGLAGLDGL
jgi:para-nitrobenzyl esterase